MRGVRYGIVLPAGNLPGRCMIMQGVYLAAMHIMQDDLTVCGRLVTYLAIMLRLCEDMPYQWHITCAGRPTCSKQLGSRRFRGDVDGR